MIPLLAPARRRIVVYGEPLSQGSKAPRVLPHEPFVRGEKCVGGRAILTEGFGDQPRRRAAWREAVAEAARIWLRENGAPDPLDGPLEMWARFYLPRPASLPKRMTLPCRKPDLIKLARAAEDSLSKLLYTDDARIVESHLSKRYAIGAPPHAVIEIAPFTL